MTVKKALCHALCIIMIAILLCPLAIGVHADAVIDTVSVVLENEPEAGAHPPFAVLVESEGCEIADAESEGFVGGVAWTDMYTGSYVGPGDTLVADRSYEVTIMLRTSSDEYLFKRTGDGLPLVEGTVNGNNAIFENTESENLIALRAMFTARKSGIKIDSVGVTGFERPSAGKAPDFIGSKLPGGFYEFSEYGAEGYRGGVLWLDMNTGKALTPSDKFTSGHAYQLRILLVPHDMYEFKTVLNHPEVEATVNGEKASVADQGMPRYEIELCVNYFDLHSHVFTEWQETEIATCWYEGTKYRYCPDCGYYEYENVPMLEHDYYIVNGVPADCKHEGMKTHYLCHNCSLCFDENKQICDQEDLFTPVDPEKHGYVGEEYESDDASHWKKCECGAKVNVESHSYGEWKTDVEPTETSAGKRTRECAVCGKSVSEEIPPVDKNHEHKYVWKSDESGHRQVCEECGEETSAGEHDLKDGKCTVCGYEVKSGASGNGDGSDESAGGFIWLIIAIGACIAVAAVVIVILALKLRKVNKAAGK